MTKIRERVATSVALCVAFRVLFARDLAQPKRSAQPLSFAVFSLFIHTHKVHCMCACTLCTGRHHGGRPGGLARAAASVAAAPPPAGRAGNPAGGGGGWRRRHAIGRALRRFRLDHPKAKEHDEGAPRAAAEPRQQPLGCARQLDEELVDLRARRLERMQRPLLRRDRRGALGVERLGASRARRRRPRRAHLARVPLVQRRHLRGVRRRDGRRRPPPPSPPPRAPPHRLFATESAAPPRPPWRPRSPRRPHARPARGRRGRPPPRPRPRARPFSLACLAPAEAYAARSAATTASTRTPCLRRLCLAVKLRLLLGLAHLRPWSAPRPPAPTPPPPPARPPRAPRPRSLATADGEGNRLCSASSLCSDASVTRRLACCASPPPLRRRRRRRRRRRQHRRR